jgi:predicted nucleic acid-binding protein
LSTIDRVFLDANILFSAAYRENAGLARLWELDGVTLLSSHYAAEESRRNLPAAAMDRFESLLATVFLVGEQSVRPNLPEGISLPENDRPILSAALELRATHLLSGDRRAFGPYFGRSIEGILILRPADYFQMRVR